MVFTIALLPLFVLAQSQECTESHLGYGFSECSHANTRKAYFYWKTPCTGGIALPRPIEDLDCKKECHAGQMLDIDIVNRKQICSYCPENTFNIGGGDLFTGNRGDWQNFTNSFTAFCYTSNIVQLEEGKNCTSWSSTLDGGKIVSGDTTDEAWVESRLVYSANLVKQGILQVEYSKDAQMYEGLMNGELSIIINGDKVYSDMEHSQDLWKTVTLPLQIGQVEIEIVYEKFNGVGCENLNAEIVQFEVRGTDFSSHSCLPCLTGFSKRGSASCDLCGFDQYLKLSEDPDEISNCMDCPKGFWARKGSIGVKSCVAKLPCTHNDYTSRLLPCRGGVRTREYYWAEPQICSEELAPNVVLPLSVEVPCAPCNAGFHRQIQDTMESECVPCPDGTYRDHDDPQEICADCEAGTFALKLLNYTSFSPIPHGFHTSCQTYSKEECYSSQGWIGTEDEINSGYNLEPRIELTISRNFTFTHEGSYVQFVYTLVNNQLGSNWMTFEIDGRIHSVVERSQHQAWSPRSYITTGRHLLKWVYIHAASAPDASDYMALHQLIIYGTDEGGAATCEHCFSGFASDSHSSMCDPCPAGTMDAKNHTECATCTDNTMTQYPGSYGGCLDCPNLTVADASHSSCISDGILELADGRVLSIANITGIHPPKGNSEVRPETGYSSGI